MADQGSVSDAEVAPPDRTRLAGSPISWAGFWVAAVALAAACRILRLIDLHAVNLLYWDQFHFYEAFARDAGAWELFRWQHGPHRQGITFLLTGWIANGTDWNTRCDAFAVGAAVCAATGLALWLRRRLYGAFHAADAAIPLLLLTPAQYGIFIHTPNLSHSAGPLLLLLAFCLAFTLRRRTHRYAAIVILDFLMIHTGFGLFAGALAPLLLGLCALHDWHERGAKGLRLPGLCVALSLVSVGIFAVGYATADLDQVASTRAPFAAYMGYVSLMFANVLGLKGVARVPLLLGMLAALAALGVAVEQLVRLLRGKPDQGRFVILTLTAFSLLFAAGTAFGRIGLGYSGAQATRYVPLVVPAFLGLYLRLQQVERPRLRVALLALGATWIAVANVPMGASEARFMHHLSSGKRIWVDAYLATGSIEAADERAGLKAFPFAIPDVPRMLEYMRERRLNFFRDAG